MLNFFVRTSYVQCNYGNCQSTFHPSCARNDGYYLYAKYMGGGKMQHKAYCSKHSLEQRSKVESHLLFWKFFFVWQFVCHILYDINLTSLCYFGDQADTQKHGAEDLKIVKQHRVSGRLHMAVIVQACHTFCLVLL